MLYVATLIFGTTLLQGYSTVITYNVIIRMILWNDNQVTCTSPKLAGIQTKCMSCVVMGPAVYGTLVLYCMYLLQCHCAGQLTTLYYTSPIRTYTRRAFGCNSRAVHVRHQYCVMNSPGLTATTHDDSLVHSCGSVPTYAFPSLTYTQHC